MFVVLTVTQNCAAEDIWVAHWNSYNIDLYAIEDTITSDITDIGYRQFTVSTKVVKDGQLQQIIEWTFSKYKNDMWRYETNMMDDLRTTIVIPRNVVFEFCMDKIGWSYVIKDDHGIKWYY